MLCYTVVHETIRKPSAAGEAAPTRHPSAPGGQDTRGNGRGSRRLEELCPSLATGPSAERGWWPGSKAGPRSPSQIDRLAKGEACDVASARPPVIGLPHGPVDRSQSAGGDSEAIRDRLPSESSLAFSRGVGVELPEAGEAGQGERRSGHCSVEEASVAPYKKRPQDVVPTLCSLMKRAVCSFPMSAGPGRLAGRRLFCGIGAGEIGSRLFRRLPSALRGTIWGCTGGITQPISRVFRYVLSSAICCSIYPATSFSCGTRAPRTRAASPRSSLRSILGFIQSPSRGMLLNSIPTSMSGQASSATWPIPPQTISRNWGTFLRILYSESVDHRNCSHPVFVHPTCLQRILFRPITYA